MCDCGHLVSNSKTINQYQFVFADKLTEVRGKTKFDTLLFDVLVCNDKKAISGSPSPIIT